MERVIRGSVDKTKFIQVLLDQKRDASDYVDSNR